jgi:hypothetical protein
MSQSAQNTELIALLQPWQRSCSGSIFQAAANTSTELPALAMSTSQAPQ